MSKNLVFVYAKERLEYLQFEKLIPVTVRVFPTNKSTVILIFSILHSCILYLYKYEKMVGGCLSKTPNLNDFRFTQAHTVYSPNMERAGGFLQMMQGRAEEIILSLQVDNKSTSSLA